MCIWQVQMAGATTDLLLAFSLTEDWPADGILAVKLPPELTIDAASLQVSPLLMLVDKRVSRICAHIRS
jgi:hypothetical protein